MLNESLCLKDGLCTRVCPARRLVRGSDGHPEERPDVRCLACGHCSAVCPVGAMSLDGASDDKLEQLAPDWRLDVDKVGQLLKGRRSIRAFRKEPLSRETLAHMIGLAQYAPSGHNAQPLSWTVISDGLAIRRVADATVTWMRKCLAEKHPLATVLGMANVISTWEEGLDPICRQAPHLIVAHAPADFPAGAHSAAIAMTYLELAALPLGAGTCWAGFVFVGVGVSPELHASLGLPADQRCAGIVMAGRPAVTYQRIPRRNLPRIAWA